MDRAVVVMSLLLLLMVVLIGVAVFGGLFVDEGIAVRALETHGFTDVNITARHWFLVGLQGCSDRDSAKFDAFAVNPAGQRVEVFVCAGFPFKGATVRTK